MAEREASGEFDYLLGDLTEAEESIGDDVLPHRAPTQEADHLPGSDYHRAEPEAPGWADEPRNGVGADGSFDAFDESTWHFDPSPPPWYRTKQSAIALVATAVAAIALVVSGVLLVFRGPSTSVDETTSVTPTAPTTVAQSESASSPESPPPPPPPPPPPAETSAAPAAPPAETYQPRPPRSTKPPEIGVTRTPVTRLPLSVAPQRPGPRPTP